MKSRTPTKAEQQWLDAIVELGCIVCLEHHEVFSPGMPHHIDGKTKEGAHFNTICLCHEHHQSGRADKECVSRHPYKVRFEERYGAESYLMERTKERLGF